MPVKRLLKTFRANIDIQTNIARGRGLLIVNLLLILFQFGYISLRYKYINDFIPFWFTQNWGDPMLAEKKFIYLIPASAVVILLLALFFEFLLRRYFVQYIKEVLITFCTLGTILLTISLLRIIFSASAPFPPLINPLVLLLVIPFITGFLVSYILLPVFIDFAFEKDIVTNPKVHLHPAMILSTASARGGGAFYAAVFLVLAFVFVGITKDLLGFMITVLMLGVLGFVDDYQNTHQNSSFKALENPFLRLFLMLAAISVLVLSGIVIKSIGNPFGGIFDLTIYKFVLGGVQYELIPFVFTVIWVAWVINLLSWSNGIDGQYTGIISIASLFICFLALRFVPLTTEFRQVAILAALSSGITFGFSKYTWFPSKIMWGFGATAAGVVIASLSIIINTKILVSILILLIPFLDASVTFIRRILQKRSPLVGDRGHFHHLLLDLGWPAQKIARFYWVTTFIFGLIAVFASDRYLMQTVLIVGGICAFFIVLLNLKSLKKKPA